MKNLSRKGHDRAAASGTGIMPESGGCAYAGEPLGELLRREQPGGSPRRTARQPLPAPEESTAGLYADPPPVRSAHPITLIVNAGSEAVAQPSLTVMMMFE